MSEKEIGKGLCTKDVRCSAASHFGDCQSMPSPPNCKAIKDCAVWLKFCLDIGWPKSSLDDLERLWRKWRDKTGGR